MLYGHCTPPNFWSDKENFFGSMITFYVSGVGSNVLYGKCRTHQTLSIGMFFI
jgi:hypothetical protein